MVTKLTQIDWHTTPDELRLLANNMERRSKTLNCGDSKVMLIESSKESDVVLRILVDNDYVLKVTT